MTSINKTALRILKSGNNVNTVNPTYGRKMPLI